MDSFRPGVSLYVRILDCGTLFMKRSLLKSVELQESPKYFKIMIKLCNTWNSTMNQGAYSCLAQVLQDLIMDMDSTVNNCLHGLVIERLRSGLLSCSPSAGVCSVWLSFRLFLHCSCIAPALGFWPFQKTQNLFNGPLVWFSSSALTLWDWINLSMDRADVK